MSSILTVSQLNRYISFKLKDDIKLRGILVKGEISGFTNHYKTGHFYFTLKDGESMIKAVMFSSFASRLKFMPENGMRVIARGRISVFERDGQYQLYIDDMQPDGLGALNLAFEQLKNKLAQEGLFDESRKQPIPHRCTRIGVVTSATGAVIQDIRNVVSRRYPLAEIILAPVQVQGASAAPQIVDAIERFNSGDYADVLIVGRGGGSLEDLWAFNEEIVARAVFNSRVPIISAVGHETDFTICDFVADLRAPTPSAAAELAVPDIREDIAFVQTVTYECEAMLLQRLAEEKNKLDIIKERLEYRSPVMLIDQRLQLVDSYMTSALLSVQRKLDTENARFSATAARLDALSPLKVMARGYSIVTKDKKVVTSSEMLERGDTVTVGFADGERNCEVL